MFEQKLGAMRRVVTTFAAPAMAIGILAAGPAPAVANNFGNVVGGFVGGFVGGVLGGALAAAIPTLLQPAAAAPGERRRGSICRFLAAERRELPAMPSPRLRRLRPPIRR